MNNYFDKILRKARIHIWKRTHRYKAIFAPSVADLDCIFGDLEQKEGQSQGPWFIKVGNVLKTIKLSL